MTDQLSAVDRIAQLVEDIEAIPGVIDRLASEGVSSSIRAALRKVGETSPRRLVVAGLGSSRYAALQAEASLRNAGIDVDIQPASSDTLPALRNALCIVISSSGRTPEALKVAARYAGTVPVLAITRDADSPLAAAADAVVPLPIGPEASGVAVPTFVATIGVLELLAAELRGAERPDLGAAAAGARAVLDSRTTWLPRALETVEGGVEEIAVLAPWSSRGIAEQAALLFRECARRSATTFETADWLHTGVYTMLPGSLALLFEGSPADHEIERTIRSRGGILLRGDHLGAGGGVTSGHRSPARELSRITGAALFAAEWWRMVVDAPAAARG